MVRMIHLEPNQPTAPNPAITPLFETVLYSRGIGEPGRSPVAASLSV